MMIPLALALMTYSCMKICGARAKLPSIYHSVASHKKCNCSSVAKITILSSDCGPLSERRNLLLSSPPEVVQSP
ncbi:hypothetical protein JTE90_028040 [Oedothorax gibbosus]|uniref:Secreted protein n=1 Tax=Oedothorax gibbosus TaxID=931172 RepID=A0AAV6TMX7_9ARAC|nr:hypothetical protein JTE90_028040 [Oedothorax gibbosus]